MQVAARLVETGGEQDLGIKLCRTCVERACREFQQ
jgi:hypothetical protein